MADFTITHRIEAPELAAAINNLADALKARPVAVPTMPGAVTHSSPEMPAAASTTPAAASATPAAPVVDANPTPAPVTPAVQNTAPAAPTAPTVAAPTSAPVEAPATTPAKVYTFDDITAAGSQLLELGKMNQLMELLKGYGVQAVTQLKPEQYADVAAGLRGLGAKI